uniref:MADF domain-containing protein n=1 Tax=Sipha flava TaxID=143950 RepID=A0A2S2QRJ1_9HEMI
MKKQFDIFKFLEEYEKFHCLWDKDSADFKIRAKRDSAEEYLLKTFNITTVKELRQKIRSIRCTYNQEVSKIKSSITTGSGLNTVYKPKLVWFEFANSFLKKTHQNKNETYTNLNDSTPCSSMIVDLNLSKIGFDAPNSATSLTTVNRSKPIKKNSNTLDKTLTNKDLLCVHDHFKLPVQQDDRFDIFGKNVAMKLRDLTKEQRIFAENIINEALFLGEMDTLTIDHKILGSPYN